MRKKWETQYIVTINKWLLSLSKNIVSIGHEVSVQVSHLHGHSVSHQAKLNKQYDKGGFEDRRNNRNKGKIMY